MQNKKMWRGRQARQTANTVFCDLLLAFSTGEIRWEQRRIGDWIAEHCRHAEPGLRTHEVTEVDEMKPYVPLHCLYLNGAATQSAVHQEALLPFACTLRLPQPSPTDRTLWLLPFPRGGAGTYRFPLSRPYEPGKMCVELFPICLKNEPTRCKMLARTLYKHHNK